MTDSILIAILLIPNGIPFDLYILLLLAISDEQMAILKSVKKLDNGTFRLPEGWTKDVL